MKLNDQRRDKLMKIDSKSLTLRKLFATSAAASENVREKHLAREDNSKMKQPHTNESSLSITNSKNRPTKNSNTSSAININHNKLNTKKEKSTERREEARGSERLLQEGDLFQAMYTSISLAGMHLHRSIYTLLRKPEARKQQQQQQQAQHKGTQSSRVKQATRIPFGRLTSSSFPSWASLSAVTLTALLLCLVILQAQAFFFSSQTPSSAATSSSGDNEPASASASLASSILSAIQEHGNKVAGASSSLNPSSGSGDRSPILSSISEAVSAVAAAAAPMAASALVAAMSPNSSVHSSAPSLSSALASSPGGSSGPTSGSAPASSSSVAAQPSASSSSSSSSSSIVASLSSAVASAAAAAAVAAAQNSLSGDDARSLLSSSGASTGGGSSGNRRHHHPSPNQHQSRSPGLQLALKLADAIPEVPYNILHNMKKIDHAAPFYNVGSRTSNPGSPKESIGLLGGALAGGSGTSTNRFTGAAEQLSQLFKSPLWKRMTENYKDFTSEFRTLFKAQAASAMKRPATSSSSMKLLRDISLPALIMLAASATSHERWRPVRTRRKSFPQADLLQAIDPMMAGSTEGVQSLSAVPMFTALPQGYSAMLMPQQPYQQIQAREFNPVSQLFNQQQVEQQQQQQQQAAANLQPRPADINLQPMEISSASQWLRAQQQPLTGQSNYAAMNMQQPIRRVGEMPAPTGSSSNSLVGPSPFRAQRSKKQHSQEQMVKPVDSSDQHSIVASSPTQAQSFSSLLSSLTSGLMSGQQTLNKLINVNSPLELLENSIGNSQFRMGNLADENKMFLLIPRRDLLGDKHRYSLVDNELTTPVSPATQQQVSANEQRSSTGTSSSSSSSKPFLLSAMSNALSSIFANPPHGESGFSSSYGGEASAASHLFSRKPTSLNSVNNAKNGHQFHLLGEKTINYRDSILRRNQQAAAGSEHRELSQLIPQSWREVVKRTVNSVQQQATSQWKSIEGQLTSWVQDKLKTIPVAASPPSLSSSSSPSSPAPVSNIFATVGSTAMNIFGLGGNRNSSTSTTSDSASTTSMESDSQSFKNKNDSGTRNKIVTPKSTLLGVANLIVNTFTNRQPSTSATSPNQSTSNSSKSKDTVIIKDSPESTSSTNLSHYQTLTGTQPSQLQSESSSASSSMASGTASTVAGITGNLMAA